MGKAFCAKHYQAYEISLGCNYCDPQDIKIIQGEESIQYKQLVSGVGLTISPLPTGGTGGSITITGATGGPTGGITISPGKGIIVPLPAQFPGTTPKPFTMLELFPPNTINYICGLAGVGKTNFVDTFSNSEFHDKDMDGFQVSNRRYNLYYNKFNMKIVNVTKLSEIINAYKTHPLSLGTTNRGNLLIHIEHEDFINDALIKKSDIPADSTIIVTKRTMCTALELAEANSELHLSRGPGTFWDFSVNWHRTLNPGTLSINTIITKFSIDKNNCL